jgi:hypothetical protein
LFALEIRNTAGNVEKYPVLITETIEGDTLREIPNAVDRLISNGVANDSLSWLLILSILTKPGDGRHSNYLVNSSEDIFCVDNENSFVEPLCRGKLWNSLQFSTVLFGKVVFLSQTVLQAFASLNIDLILDEWVNDLIKKEAQLHALFPPILEGGRPLRASFKPVDVQRFYEQNPEDSFTSSILLREGTVLGLHLQFWHLQKFIKEKLQQEKSISSDELLQEMISVRDGGWKNRIGPDVHRLYHKGQKQKGMAPSQSSSQAHRAVFGKVPSFEEIAKKELFSPAKAKAELLGSILDVSHVFGKDTKPHDRIDMDFAEMDATRANLIIDTLISILTAATQKPKHLVFRGASHLTSKQLSNFLHPGLISLRLTGSANIREKDLLNVAKICASLEELYIEEVPLTKLGPIEFPRLEHCLIARMPFLTSLSLKAPCLVRLDISENPGMRTLRLGCERFPLIELESTPLTDFPSLESVSNQLFTHMELLLTKGKLEALASSLGLSLPVVPPPPNPHTLEEFANARHLYKKILSVYEEGSPSLKKQIDIELLLKTLGYILRKLNDYDFALQELVEARLCQTVADQAMQDSSAKEAEQRILAEEVFNTWNQEVIKKSTTFVENVRAAWKVSLGEIDPPYPPSREIDQILDAPCSMIEGKTIRETHKLIWVPKTVNGQPLTLRLLISLMEERDYRKGNPYTIWEKLGEFLDEPILNSYWMIMAPHPFPRSLGQNRAFFSQWEATDQGKVYRPTKIIEAAIAFAMSRYYYTDWVFFFKYGVACLEEYKYSLGSLVKDYLHYTVVLGPPNERNLIRGVPFEAGQKDVGLLGVIRLDKMGGGISKMSDVSA